MHLKVLYLLFSALFGARSHAGPYRGDGPPGYLAHPQPGGPQDGLPGAHDANHALSTNSRPLPTHSFEKRVLKSGAGKKVFVKFIQGPFTFKKKEGKG